MVPDSKYKIYLPLHNKYYIRYNSFGKMSHYIYMTQAYGYISFVQVQSHIFSDLFSFVKDTFLKFVARDSRPLYWPLPALICPVGLEALSTLLYEQHHSDELINGI